LVFHYDESELNSIAEANLVLFKSTDGGSTWVLAGGTVNTSSNTVTLTGIDGFSRWTLGSSGAPLPVELVTLTAVGNRTGATLHWKTETETRCYGFDVERKAISDPWLSDNGWHKIGFVAGAGTSNAPHDYTFVDVKVAPGKYAYRLKQIDNDGSVAYYYSPDVEIGAAPKVLTLGNFPNPFNPVTTIQFSVPADGHATLKVYNIAGQEVAKAFDSPVIAGRYYQAQFDGSRLASGSYFYVLQSGEFRSVKRMMLLK
jgi:hypothetical protein